MQIEICLKKLLQQHGLDSYGVTQRISSELEVHRHTIGKLYRNQASNPSLEVLGSLCDWLERNGVPAESLPQALFGARPYGLWQAIAKPGAVTLYVGEYREVKLPRRTARWVAQHDAVVMAKVIQSLSSPRDLEAQRVRIGIEYVPLRFRQDALEPKPTNLDDEIDTARRMFTDMRPPHRHRSTILLGSQRVNHLVELFVSDTFRCTPFHQLKRGRPKVPFYLVYREDDRAVPSCFGGPQLPPGCAKPCGPGIYFDTRDGWVACPWTENEQDAGVIIVLRDSGTDTLEMAVFGFSGQGTEAVGEELFKHPDRFWPPGFEVDGNQLGVYICKFSFTKQPTADDDGGAIITDAEVIQLDEQVLRQYVR